MAFDHNFSNHRNIFFLMTLCLTSIVLISYSNLGITFNKNIAYDLDTNKFPGFQNYEAKESAIDIKKVVPEPHAVTPSKSAFGKFEDDDARVDNRKVDLPEMLNETVDIVRSFPSQPFIVNGNAPSFNKTCANFPTLFHIEFDNTHWQVMNSPNGTMYLYGAYYDNRNLTMNANETLGPAVRLLGMMDWNLHLDNTTTYYCQMWFEGEKAPVFSQVVDQRFIWKYGKGRLQIFLFACNITEPFQDKVPLSVSVVVNPCNQATNNLRVQYEKSLEKKDFAVCVKGLDFLHDDLSVRLVEWVELLRILGADKIFLYEFTVHPNASKVLRYYESTDYVDVTPLTLPGGFPNDPRLRHIYLKKRITDKRANELIPYNDCLYRNLYKYKRIALLDPDETIVPLKVSSWNELTSQLEKAHPKDFDIFTSICFRNVYFFDTWMQNRTQFPNIPKFMHQLQHVYRSFNYSGKGAATKCLHNTERVISLHNHFPVHCFDKCKTLHVETNDGQMQHYKPECPGSLKNCSLIFGGDPVLDNNLWRFKDDLINNTLSVLKPLGFISNASAESWWARLQKIDLSNMFKLKS